MENQEEIQNKKKAKASSDKRYREKNKEKIAKKKREYYQKNKDKIRCNPKTKESRKKFYDANKEKINEKRKQNRLMNLEESKEKERKRKAEYKKNIKNRNKWLETTKKYIKNRIKCDPAYKLKIYYRNYIGKAKRKKGFKKDSKTAEYLGCDWQTFKNHIENQFETWMNWENWGPYRSGSNRTWNIDHIKPLAKYNLLDPDEIKKAFHYTNCRPYCSKANLVEQHYR